MATPTHQLTDIGVQDHIAVEIPTAGSYDPLVLFLKEKMETKTTASCICRVNKKLVEKNADQYIPQNIAIGPFHRDKNHLKTLEEHKWRYVLVQDERDAKLLKAKQILTNYDVIEKKQVSTLFDRLWEDMNVTENVSNFEFYYDGLCEEVKEYKGTSWRQPKWDWKPMKEMKPGLILQRRPLPRIAVVIAVVFILLVLVGALFSIISFFHHRF
ncbi:hypothetical protein CCACVL1_28575 [Corchorus capsularis]|uniref:Uncharacterized protein n=1 Tax=Corchorus capsularis TaxID=210143 RepID=A0A1R3G643_COCAP|nr:hypothetical protein CCACVL1_28575 [Corchorus capsularis]